MIIYVDILLIVNFIIDYFLLCLTAKLAKIDARLVFRILGAAVAALSSLYIFLPQSPFIIEISVRVVLSFIITFITFGKRKMRQLLRASAIFFAVTFGFAGAMIFIWLLFEPNGMAINNSVVYFNVSPLFLIGFSVAGYFIVSIARYFLEKLSPKAQNCTVEISAEGRKITLAAIVDTGNSLTDVFGTGQVIIADSAAAYQLFGADVAARFKNRYRAIPCGTVTGGDLLDGYRCDSAKISVDGEEIRLESPILALSKVPLEDCGAIINPRSIT